MRFSLTILTCALLLVPFAFAESARPHPQRTGARAAHAAQAVSGQKLEARKRFVLDVLQSAIALPQSDPQDHLRVLLSAARVASSVSAKLSRSLARQGIEVETQLIATGQKPAVSMLESGLVDCSAVAGFVDAVRPESIHEAEQSLIAAVGACPKQALEGIQRELTDGMRQGSAAPRLLMSAMEAAGAKSAWTAQQFSDVFSSLPDAPTSGALAPAFADLYHQFAGNLDAPAVRSAGLKLLSWLGKVPTSPERVQAVTTAAEAMKKALGPEEYNEALQSDVMASQAAQVAGQPFEVPPPDDGDSTVLVSRLFGQKEDKSAELEDMPAPRRAREAAAYGFAAAQDGDNSRAQRYFDTAFAALNEAWSQHRPGEDVVGMVEEVSQAAAHVDPVQALSRAQKLLLETPAQAVSMLTIAQVVLAKQEIQGPPRSAAK